jgi:pyruvate dehydrogenase E2 component (dihydrolipoamide acetyltransferase)
MADVIILTPLYPEMEEATIGRWCVMPGDPVAEGAVVAELITDKVAYELASPCTGTLLVTLVGEKSVVPVGTVLAVVGNPGESLPNLAEWQTENRRLTMEREMALTALHEATGADGTAPVDAPTRSVRATPAARRLARERGIDLNTVKGSGPDGMITTDDIPA